MLTKIWFENVTGGRTWNS